jgi:hypothetical protein
MDLIWYVMLWAIFATVGALLGDRVGRKTDGMIYGLLLGPLGWLFAVMMKPIDKAEVARLRAGRGVKNDLH